MNGNGSLSSFRLSCLRDEGKAVEMCVRRVSNVKSSKAKGTPNCLRGIG